MRGSDLKIGNHLPSILTGAYTVENKDYKDSEGDQEIRVQP